MISLQQISKVYGDHVVLDKVDLTLRTGEVIAVIGENGAGKTTLLKLLLGIVHPTQGNVLRHQEVVGYVAQELEAKEKLEDSFPVGTEDWRIDWSLSRVGLNMMDLQTPITSLSGGQRTRLSLAHVLAHDPEPTVLLLDEPTNNLDLDGLSWLESFIKNFHGSVLIVSHDRAFLDRVATGVIELAHGKLKRYGGNYSFYREQKLTELAAEQAHYEQVSGERKRVEAMIRVAKDRARAGVNNKKPPDNDKFAKGFFNNRIQGKFSARAKSLESRLEHLEQLPRPDSVKHYRLNLAGASSASKVILKLEKIGKRFGARQVLQDISLTIYGTDRVYISGVNGSGKTTLLQIAAGLLVPDKGSATYGSGVTISYLSQAVDGLDYHATALDNLLSTGQSITTIYNRSRILGLDEGSLAKLPGELSRGQQAKLAFAKLLFAENQLLILDEPTNHLDIPTRERLELALQQYQGAILFASHDRYFVETIHPTIEFTL